MMSAAPSTRLSRSRWRPVSFPAAVAVFLAVSAGSLRGADWPRFRGPDGQGTSPEKGLPTTWAEGENIVWKTPLPGPGTSSPIVAGDRIFVTTNGDPKALAQDGKGAESTDRHLACLHRDDGRILWSESIPGSRPEPKEIRERHGYASNTPAHDGERVYAFFGTAGVFAFDSSGKKLWQADVGSDTSGWGSAASPVVLGDLIIVNASVESQSLVALDRRTGKEKWRTPGIKDSWNTPIAVRTGKGEMEIVLAIFGKVLGIDPATGEVRWSCATDIGWYMVPSLVAAEDVVYCIGGRTGGALAVRTGGRGDVTGTHRLWTGKKGSNVSSPVLHQGRLHWMHENLGIAYCAEAKTGKLVYEERIDGFGQVYASAIAADGKLYFTSRSGTTLVLAAGPRFEVLARNSLGDRSAFNSSPAVAGGSLYLRSDRFLYRIGKKG